MSLFVNKDAEVNVKIYTAIGTDKELEFIAIEKGVLDKNEIVDKNSIVENNITFRKPNYADSVAIYKSIDYSDGKINIDLATLRYRKFIVLLKKWDFKDENGKEIAITEENINSLNPSLAGVIIDELEKIVG